MARRQGRIEGPKGRRQQREEGHKDDHERSGKGGGGTPVLLNADIDPGNPKPIAAEPR